MIPANIVRDFAAEIRQMFVDTGFISQNEEGHFVAPHVYEHTLPPPDGEESIKAPYLLIALYNGEQASGSEPRVATLHFLAETFDDDSGMQGYIDAINMIEKVSQHLYGKVIIAGKYSMAYPYQFAVLDDERYPYFSAGLAVKVELPGLTPQNQEDSRYV